MEKITSYNLIIMKLTFQKILLKSSGCDIMMMMMMFMGIINMKYDIRSSIKALS